MADLTVSIPPLLADFIEELVAGGKYGSADDVVFHALWSFHAEVAGEAPIFTGWLRSEVQKGLDDIEAGHVVDLDMDEIMREARRRNAAEI